ncbi:hypothetical protein ASE00_19440 [Sphingomonas sp. Root710]|uniref:hypothetical protein n=1 Tax=Sphingomonas sp. Root710 TaxID=1736594 RepID=UPI0006FFBE98|nr:hypothetical protein [Sphingomonas sp. Root710]KRB79872.1 hypothetical protein ASE00_19440 [Sphingomonas sp. Root710]
MNSMTKPKASSRKVNRGGASEPMTQMSEMLMTQALTLDGMFTELVDHAATNLPQYPLTGERFARLALRAQSNCSASLVAMAKAQKALRPAQDDAAE